jgi:hypothetical protein
MKNERTTGRSHPITIDRLIERNGEFEIVYKRRMYDRIEYYHAPCSVEHARAVIEINCFYDKKKESDGSFTYNL